MDFSKIKAFAFDIDGVMTNGGILAMPDGDLLRTYDAKDSFAIRMATMNGYPVGIITGGSSESIRRRFAYCGVLPEDVFLHSRNKLTDFHKFCDRYGLRSEEVMFFGDDIPDIGVMKECGISVAPSDACEEVLEIADIVSPNPGGKQVIRHMFKKVMSAQGRWVFHDDVYAAKF